MCLGESMRESQKPESLSPDERAAVHEIVDELHQLSSDLRSGDVSFREGRYRTIVAEAAIDAFLLIRVRSS